MPVETELENRSVSISDIALALGITKATVSYALNGKGRVAPSTREKVLQTAQEMGFQPNPHAQRLSTGRSSNTVALCFELDLGVNARKLQVIQGLFMEQGYEIPSHAISQAGTPQVDRQTTETVSTVWRQRPRAIATSKLPSGALEELKRYQAEGGIVICYDTGVDLDCDQVFFDREYSSYLATKYLLELGHRNIGFCAPGSKVPEGLYLEGYYRALHEQGLKPNLESVFCIETHGFTGGIYEEAGAQLAKQFLQLEHRPTAMCISDDYSAMAFAAAIEEAGLRVPQDVSIVGHDDSPIARYGPLKLTTVTHPVEAIAQQVVKFVRSRIEENIDSPPRTVVLRGELVVRSSTAKFDSPEH